MERNGSRMVLRPRAAALALAALAVAVALMAGWPNGGSEAGKRRTVLAAVVDADGVLHRGKGAVASEHVDLGQYVVVFKQDVSTCTYVVSQGGHDNFTHPLGSAQATNAQTNKGVFVRTWNSIGNDNRGFHLVVVC